MDVVDQHATTETAETTDYELPIAATDSTSRIVAAQVEDIQVEEPTQENVEEVITD